MISGTQDDEDTQSDEAEAEAAEAEEEQSEEAKVAADPEDQPAATETPKEEKGRKRNTEKGSCREQLRQYFLRRKNTSQKSQKTGTAV